MDEGRHKLDEPLNRAENGAVNDHRATLSAVLLDVGQVKADRELEVELNGGALVLTT